MPDTPSAPTQTPPPRSLDSVLRQLDTYAYIAGLHANNVTAIDGTILRDAIHYLRAAPAKPPTPLTPREEAAMKYGILALESEDDRAALRALRDRLMDALAKAPEPQPPATGQGEGTGDEEGVSR